MKLFTLNVELAVKLNSITNTKRVQSVEKNLQRELKRRRRSKKKRNKYSSRPKREKKFIANRTRAPRRYHFTWRLP